MEGDNIIELPQYDRIRAHSSARVNAQIDENIRQNVEKCAHFPEAIEQRLLELDKEWDIDRALMAQFSVLSFGALMAGIFRDRRWFFLPAVQIPFLFLHAVIGWCPPLPLLRRQGFRSRQEIEAERTALRKAGARDYQPGFQLARGAPSGS